MSEQNEALAEIGRDIERAARHVKLEWNDIVDSWEDMYSEIVVRLLRDNYAVKVRDMDPKPRRQVLHKIGVQIASQMRVDYDHFTGNFRYSTEEVRQILENGALEQAGYDIDQAFYLPLYTAGETPLMEMRVEDFDARSCFYRLAENHQEILLRRYVKLERLTNDERKAVTRAVDVLTNQMNTSFNKAKAEYDGPGSKNMFPKGGDPE